MGVNGFTPPETIRFCAIPRSGCRRGKEWEAVRPPIPYPEAAPMQAPSALLKFVAKAFLNAVGGGVAGDFAVEVVPDLARDVWKWWGKGRPEEQLREEVQELAQM